MILKNGSRPATALTVCEPREYDQLGRQIGSDDNQPASQLQVLRLIGRFKLSRRHAETVAFLAFGEARQ